MNQKKEISGLNNALHFFGLKEGVVVTHDQSDLFDIEDISIKLIPGWKYLSSD